MGNFEVISIDMFQTLVDVNKRIPNIWKMILKENYTEKLAIQGAQAVMKYFPPIYEDACVQFCTMEDAYTRCAKEVGRELPYQVSAEKAAHAIMYQHGLAPMYEDVIECLPELKKRGKVILSSDSNHLMVDRILEKLGISKSFISDELEAYKGDKQGKFFRRVLEELKVPPEKVLHIGDSSADIIGAKQAGMKACWINREQFTWKKDMKPDYVVSNFKELLDII